MRSSHFAAILLLSVFAGGSLVAPVSHYAFMAWNDPGMLPAVPAPNQERPASPDGVFLLAAQHAHGALCDYGELIATLVLLSPQTASDAPAPPPPLEIPHIHVEPFGLQSSSGTLAPVRGPPARSGMPVA